MKLQSRKRRTADGGVPAKLPIALSLLVNLQMTFRAISELPRYLCQPLAPAECRAILQTRLAQREDDFLYLARSTIYADDSSPYRALLRHAGCEYGDLDRLVRKEGLEAALAVLFREGVYLSADEFKGRRPAVRGGMTIAAGADLLRNPLTVPHFWTTTGGSRGAAALVRLDLACIRDRAVNTCLALDARGGMNWRHAIWSTRGIAPVLWHSGWGGPAVRWFLQADPGLPSMRSRFGMAIRLIAWSSRLAGRPIPFPERVPADAPLPIFRWMERTIRGGETPHLWAAPSVVVRMCRAAEEAGIDLAGARFTITGEPVTEARLAAIRRVHGDAVPDYGSVDSGGSLSYGCLSPDAVDDVHFFSDIAGLIQADGPPLPEGALLVTSLRATAPFILLNVSMGDRATVSRRSCGCPLEALGWKTHLRGIGSFEKLTAGGVTFDDCEIIPLLEEELPRIFGGGPTDYQLVEEEGDCGQPRIRLLVHPSVGDVDPDAVAHAFLEAIGGRSENKRDMAAQWRQAGILRVEREAPRLTSSGKILHLVAGATTGREILHE